MSAAPSAHALVRALPLALALLAAAPVAELLARPNAAGTSHTSTDARRLDVVVRGVVTDAATGRPVEGAQVYAPASSTGAVTSASGAYTFTLRGLARGERVLLQVRRIGYTGVERTLRADSATIILDVVLTASAAGLATQRIVEGSGAAGKSVLGNGQGGQGSRTPGNTRPGRPGSRTEAAPASAVGEAFGTGTGGRMVGDVSGVLRGVDVGSANAPPPAGVPDAIRRRSAPWNTEEYARIEDNPFLGAKAHPLSTFSIDVDRASYANVRRYLAQGQRPPKDAVRIEELVNYFRYDYDAPSGRHPIAIHTELAAAPWQPAHRLLRIGVQGQRIDLRSAPANNLVFLVDVSGSMQPENRLPLLRRAFRLLVDELREQDRVSIVVYAGAAGLVLPPTSGEDKAKIHAAIDALEAGGSTAGGAGIRLAYDIARQHHVRGGNNRVILATDGDFNVGVSSTSELVRLVEERREQGTFLTVLGVGMGNYKDGRLEQLADKGNGNFSYIDDLLEARKVLVTEMGGTLVTIARDVKLQVEFNPARVAAYRLIGYENRILRAEDFNDDRKDAGELGAGHTVTALYEVVPVGTEGTVRLGGVDSLRYVRPDPSTAPRPAGSGELAFVKLRYKEPTGSTSRLLEHAVADRVGRPSTDFTFAAAVAGFGMLLRESEHKGAADWRMIARLAREGRGHDAEGYRSEFLRLVEGAVGKELAGHER